MTRVFLTAFSAACVAFAPQAMAQFTIGPGTFGTSGPAQSSSIKSSKSNTSDRMGGGGGGQGGTTRTTTVKSSKSNTSDRLGGGGGGGPDGTARTTNLNQGSLTITMDPPGSYFNPTVNLMNLRFDKTFKITENQSITGMWTSSS